MEEVRTRILCTTHGILFGFSVWLFRTPEALPLLLFIGGMEENAGDDFDANEHRMLDIPDDTGSHPIFAGRTRLPVFSCERFLSAKTILRGTEPSPFPHA